MDSKDLEACGFGLGRACQLELRAPISLPLCLSDAWILPKNVYLAKWREMNLLYLIQILQEAIFPSPGHMLVTSVSL